MHNNLDPYLLLRNIERSAERQPANNHVLLSPYNGLDFPEATGESLREQRAESIYIYIAD